MEFFCYHRDRPGSGALRERLLEQHWSYMDGFADRLIARGPTFGEEDGAGPSGSVHLVDLPDPLSARAFAFEEPNYQAGVYGSVLLLRWRNLLGRTMWQFPGGRTGGHRYLVLGLGLESGLGEPGLGEPGDVLPSVVDELIAYGPLLSDDGGTWLGTAALLRAPDPVAARAVLHPHRYADVGVHRWQFGGRAPTLPLQCNQCACEVPESAMKTLYLRNVPDEVVERLERLAALAGTSVSALAVRELSEVSRRVDNEAVLDALPDLGIAMADVVADLDDARSDR